MSLFLITCGGGGGSPTEPTPPPSPTVQNIEFTTPEDTPKTFSFMGSEPQNLALTYSVSTQPEHGTVSVSGGSGTYTPNANYNGVDTFSYIAISTSGNSNIGIVLVNISAVDDNPNTMNVSAVTDEDNSIEITLEAEEYDGDAIIFNIKDNPDNGAVTLSGDKATYTPNENYFGSDSFTFEAVDTSAKKIINTATASITVNPINDAPTVDDINDQQVSVGESIAINLYGNDIENDNLSYEIVDTPNKGTVSITHSGNYATYIAQSTTGSDTFTYKANDGNDDSNVATVSIEIDFTKYFTIGGSSTWCRAYDIIEASDGGYILAGYCTYGNDDRGLYLVKTDILGNKVWDQLIEDIEGAGSITLAVDGSGYAISSNYGGDMMIIGIDEDGEPIWANQIGNGGGGNGDTNALSIKPNNNGYIIAGATETKPGDSSSWNFDSYLVAIDNSGNVSWDKNIGTDYWEYGSDSMKDICIINDGNYVSLSSGGGVSIFKTDNTGNVLWHKNYSAESDWMISGETIEETTDGGFIIAGSHYEDVGVIFPSYLSNGFLMKFDASGNEEWNNFYGGSNNDQFSDVKVTPDGGYIAVGHTLSDGSTGIPKIYVVKTDSSGSEEWNRVIPARNQYGSSSEAYCVYVTSDGSYIIGGTANQSVFLVKLDSQGNRIL